MGSLRDLIAELAGSVDLDVFQDEQVADVILAHPDIHELLAAADRGRRGLSPKVRAMLDDWALQHWGGPDDR